MLLFIIIPSDWNRYTTKFQYISCYCLSSIITPSSSSFIDFNTSHVTVYLCFQSQTSLLVLISIHLMLLFISMSFHSSTLSSDFNTSHVTVYPYPIISISIAINDFNTSHVTVYQKGIQ